MELEEKWSGIWDGIKQEDVFRDQNTYFQKKINICVLLISSSNLILYCTYQFLKSDK